MTDMSLSTGACLMLLVAFNSMVKEVNCGKPFKLSMLVSAGFTGTEPIDGTSCRAAVEIVAAFVNNRTDILPDYEIELDFRDEKAVGNNAPNSVLSFSRSFETPVIGTDGKMRYPSPAIVGPMISNGCKAVGTFLHHINFISISTTCTATILSDRTTFPNLYTTIPNANVKNYGYVRFIKDIGKWRRCAVVTFADNINNYNAAAMFFKTAIEQGVEVPWFNSIIKFDLETAVSLKSSGARIIVAIISSIQYVINLFCLTHEVGMTGPRYIYFLYDTGFPDPRKMAEELTNPAGCKRSTISEQVKYSFWMGNLDSNADMYQKSSFGYSRMDFEAMFDKYTNNARPVDYDWRLSYHDSTMQAIITLEKADQLLKAQNMSLRNFYDNPTKVMDAVNKVGMAIDYKGVRAPRLRYDNKGELYGLPNFINYWTPQSEFRKVFAIIKLENKTNYDYDSYRVEHIDKVTWLTPDGKPPRDRHQTVKILIEPTQESLFIIIILASLLAANQFVGLIYTFVKRNESFMNESMPMTKCLGLCGCLLLDIVAVVFVLETSKNPFVLWNIRIIFLVVAVSTVIGVVFLRMFSYYSIIKNATAASSPVISTVGVPYRLTERTSMPASRIVKRGWSIRISKRSRVVRTKQRDFLSTERKSVRILLALVGLNVVVVTVWLLADRMKCDNTLLEAPVYNELADTFYEKYVSSCQSIYQQAWIYSLTGFHLLMLAVSSFSAFDIRHLKRRVKCRELNYVILATAGVTTILVASILLLLIISNAASKLVVVASLCLVTSALTSFSWLFSQVSFFVKNRRSTIALTEQYSDGINRRDSISIRVSFRPRSESGGKKSNP